MPTNIICVVPTIRPDSHAAFVKAWSPLFLKHEVTLLTVWDGEVPRIETWLPDTNYEYANGGNDDPLLMMGTNRDLFCRRTDAVRNLGFVAAAAMDPTHVLTLDDDCYPVEIRGMAGGTKDCFNDPIQSHLDALERRVPLSWMNTAHDTDLYLRGVPYGVRDEAPVMLSHGVWVGTPDFDGETQLRLEAGKGIRVKGAGEMKYTDAYTEGVPHSLPYYVGPIPRGVNFPLCGMNVMVKREALPYLYYAPMGADSGVPDLHRFADIFMGVFLKREFDWLGWACVTGYSTVHHTRASDARKNVEQERLGREWMELTPEEWEDDAVGTQEMSAYFRSYQSKRDRYAKLVAGLLRKDG